MGKWIDLSGKRFSRLVVRSLTEKTDKRGSRYWLCYCDCGKATIKTTAVLNAGAAPSCGCHGRESHGKHLRTHGKSRTPAYRVWYGMMRRCYVPTEKAFVHYGGRGIFVCERWHTFENFLEDMGQPPKGLTLDRQQNNSGYFLENCRWATSKEQNRNRRDNIPFERNGQQKLLTEWAEESGLKSITVYNRIHAYGWDIEKALTTPPSIPSNRGKKLTHKGITRTIAQWAKTIGVSENCLRYRFKQGWSLHDALTLPGDTHNRPVLYSSQE